jgi:peptide chain release factor 3
MTGERAVVEKFVTEQRSAIADDVDGDPVFLATSAFMMRRTAELNPGLKFAEIKDFRAIKTAA